MLNSIYLEVALALVMVIFCLAALASLVNEAITQALQIRTKVLWKALDSVLSPQAKPVRLGLKEVLSLPMASSNAPPSVKEFAASAPIRAMTGEGRRGDDVLTMIPKESFAAAVVDAVKAPEAKIDLTNDALRVSDREKDLVAAGVNGSTSQPTGRSVFSHLVADPKNWKDDHELVGVLRKFVEDTVDGVDVTDQVVADRVEADGVVTTTEPEKPEEPTSDGALALEVMDSAMKRHDGDEPASMAELERWFDSYMEAISLRYRSATRIALFGLGVGLAAVANIDLVSLTGELFDDVNKRDTIISALEGCIAAGESAGDACNEEIEELLTKSGVKLPFLGEYHSLIAEFDSNDLGGSIIDLAKRIPGFLLAGLAVSFGAPFWFDVARKLTSLRSK